jgi:hypothetical protein
MNLYFDGVAVARIDVKPITTIVEIKQTVANFLRNQNITNYTIELRFSDGVMLDPIVFGTNTYDLVNFQQHTNQINGASILVRTIKKVESVKPQARAAQKNQIYHYYIPYNNEGYTIRDKSGRLIQMAERFDSNAYLDNNPTEDTLFGTYNGNIKFTDANYLHGVRKFAAIFTSLNKQDIKLYDNLNTAVRDYISMIYDFIVRNVTKHLFSMDMDDYDYDEVHRILENWDHIKNPHMPRSEVLTKYVSRLISSGDLSLENMISYAMNNGFLIIFPEADEYTEQITFTPITFQ